MGYRLEDLDRISVRDILVGLSIHNAELEDTYRLMWTSQRMVAFYNARAQGAIKAKTPESWMPFPWETRLLDKRKVELLKNMENDPRFPDKI